MEENEPAGSGTNPAGEAPSPVDAGAESSEVASGEDPPRIPYVVGVGASAGGLQPLEEFFQHMPADTGLAFVVVQHLSPDFKSLMRELLARHTEMAIYRVEDGMELKPNSIFLIPPKSDLTLDGETLRLQEQTPHGSGGPNFPIDTFLISLAGNFSERSMAVILSGTGSDGSRGIRSINDADGLVFVQDPASAQFDGMPHAALASGMANHVLRPSAIAQAIASYAAKVDSPMNGLAEIVDEDNESIGEILDIISRDEHVDFTHYKMATMGRRIERRRLIMGAHNLDDYAELLGASPEERAALRNDLLITVTSFFRDTAAWQVLESEVLPKMLLATDASEAIRIWVTACATGEEAYSLAIAMREVAERLDRSRQEIKIFATDIDTGALERASAGIYPDSVLADLPERRRQRYFTPRGDDYQVSRELREMIIFAPHNLVKDAPFTRMHFVSCRNALIYMQVPLQQHVLRMLHFSLRPEGTLFLGAAESAGELELEFRPINRKWNIYSKLRDVRLPLDAPLPSARTSTPGPPLRSRPTVFPSTTTRTDAPIEDIFRALTRVQDITCLVLDSHYQVMHSFGEVGSFMRFPEGAVTRDVNRLVPRSLALPLNTAFHRAQKEAVPVSYSGIQLNESPTSPLVDLRVSYHEATRSNPPFYLVVMEKAERQNGATAAADYDLESQAAQRIADLEHELNQTRENLQATIEELETTNEEQQATNEELVAANEELQSTNEELHSVNEELYTVNAEYQAKIHELTELNNDMDNLLDSTDIGVVFLDDELCIRKFTPAARRAVNLVPTDVGRPLQDLSTRAEYPELIPNIRRVLSLGTPLHKETSLDDGSNLLIGIHPYRAGNDLAVGVVLTFIDISELKRVELALKQVERRYRCLFDSNLLGIAITEAGQHVTDANDAWFSMLGRTRGELPIRMSDIVSPASRAALSEAFGGASSSWQSEPVTIDAVRADGSILPMTIGRSMLDAESNTAVEFALDVTEEVRARRDAEQRARALEEVNTELQNFAYSASHDLQEPLRMVASYVSLIEERYEAQLDDTGREFIHYARDGARRIQGLIEALLTYSRVQTHGRSFERLSLDAVVDKALMAIAEQVDETGGRIERSPLPEVDGDMMQLVEVFQHVLSNALKFHGAESPAITITSEESGAMHRVSITDNGIGIDPRFFERIFVIFQRLHSRDEYPGEGLGLALCKRIVERHRGEITVKSKLGHGATFTLSFPVPL